MLFESFGKIGGLSDVPLAGLFALKNIDNIFSHNRGDRTPVELFAAGIGLWGREACSLISRLFTG